MPDDTDFQKLLSEAPMAPTADRVTLVGILARTKDATQFMLTLADGQSVTLDVAAVRSAKTLAGAIGQSMVELELDAERVPENLRNVMPPKPATDVQDLITIPGREHTGVHDYYITYPGQLPITGVYDLTVFGMDIKHLGDKAPIFDHTLPESESGMPAGPAIGPAPPAALAFHQPVFANKLPMSDNYTASTVDLSGTAPSADTGGVLTGTHVDHITLPRADDPALRPTGNPLGGNTIQEVIGGFGGDPAYLAPFVAAMPHQASPATIAALMQGLPGSPYGWPGRKVIYDKHPWSETSPLYGQLDY